MRAIHYLFPVLLLACGGTPEDPHEGTDPGTTSPVGDDDDDDTTPEPPTEEDSVEVLITAAEGGEVVIGEATLSIPAGALAVDTTITASMAAADASLPDSSSVDGMVYDFGPNGTTFLTPAELTLPTSATPGTDEALVVSWLDEASGSWVDLATVDHGGSVTAEVEHFTAFAVRVVTVVDGVATECSPFSPCGGDPTGLWDYAAYCLEVPSGTNPYCVSGTFDIVITVNEAWVDLQAGGTYEEYIDATVEFFTTFTPNCVGAIPACSDLDDPSQNYYCTGDPAVSCSCTMTDVAIESNTGVWQAGGETLTLTEQGDDPEMVQYCVNGGWMQWLDDGGGIVELTK